MRMIASTDTIASHDRSLTQEPNQTEQSMKKQEKNTKVRCVKRLKCLYCHGTVT